MGSAKGGLVQVAEYVPVVFDIEGDSERVALGMYDGEELGVQLCAATKYLNCKEQYDTLRGRQQQLEEQLQTARTRNEVATVRTNQASLRLQLERTEERMLARYNELYNENSFSWHPLWCARDSISLAAKNDSERVRAMTVYTDIGSRVHEHLFYEAFFSDNEKNPTTLDEESAWLQKAVTDCNSDGELDAFLKGQRKERLFVPDIERMQEEEEDNIPLDAAKHNNMRSEPFSCGYSAAGDTTHTWSSNRPQEGVAELIRDYATNTTQGLKAALNSESVKEDLFGNNIEADVLQMQCSGCLGSPGVSSGLAVWCEFRTLRQGCR